MRLWRSLCRGLLLLAVFLAAGSCGVAASAADEEYTYTVRLYAGNQGALTEDGIEVKSDSAVVSFGRDCTEITGLKYGDAVYIRPQDAAASTDPRYYVRGVRRSGRDNSEAEAPAFRVACDRDFVVAYAVSGDMVAYTVNYLDGEGSQLMESDVYYGSAGERQYVSSRYIEGYQPQALNMVKTLSANEAENVFDFEYAPAEAPAAPAPTPTPAPAAPAAPGEAEAPAAPAEPEAEVPEPEEEEEPGQEIEDELVPLGGDARTGGTEDGENGGQQDVMDIDDEDVPLAPGPGGGTEQSGILMGYMPVYIGIGTAAAVILAAAAVYLKKRNRKPAVNRADADHKPSGHGKRS